VGQKYGAITRAQAVAKIKAVFDLSDVWDLAGLWRHRGRMRGRCVWSCKRRLHATARLCIPCRDGQGRREGGETKMERKRQWLGVVPGCAGALSCSKTTTYSLASCTAANDNTFLSELTCRQGIGPPDCISKRYSAALLILM